MGTTEFEGVKGFLPQDEALQLLLTSAGMGGVETGKRAFEEGGREMRWRLRSWSFAARSH